MRAKPQPELRAMEHLDQQHFSFDTQMQENEGTLDGAISATVAPTIEQEQFMNK